MWYRRQIIMARWMHRLLICRVHNSRLFNSNHSLPPYTQRALHKIKLTQTGMRRCCCCSLSLILPFFILLLLAALCVRLFPHPIPSHPSSTRCRFIIHTRIIWTVSQWVLQISYWWSTEGDSHIECVAISFRCKFSYTERTNNTHTHCGTHISPWHNCYT